MTKLQAWLVAAAKQFRTPIEIDVDVFLADGRRLHPLARLPSLGGAGGMLVFSSYDEIRTVVRELREQGFAFTVLEEPRASETMDANSFHEMFVDWGLPATGTTDLDMVWVFVADGGSSPSAVFREVESAEEWIGRNKLTGLLTEYPVGIGVYDWAVETGLFKPKPSKRIDSSFIGRFTTAAARHHHFENGRKLT